MKLLKLLLLNIQSHEKSSVTFSPYLNAIIGTTDVGKSSILRGIIQLITNKLKWDDLRRFDTKSSTISLSDETNTIKRVKSDKKNTYVVNGKELGTVRTDVPTSVFNILNINEVNIQHQKESWFLIDKSNTHISREINKVAGLSIMDKSIQALNKKIRTIKDMIRSDNNHILEVDSALLELEWAVKAEIELSSLEKYENKISRLEDQIEELDEILTEIDSENEILKRLLPSVIIDEINELLRNRSSIVSLSNKIKETEDILDDIQKCRSLIENLCEINTTELEGDNTRIKNLEEDIIEIQGILDQLEKEKVNHSECELRINNINNRLRKIRICPTCKKPFRLNENNTK